MKLLEVKWLLLDEAGDEICFVNIYKMTFAENKLQRIHQSKVICLESHLLACLFAVITFPSKMPVM